MSGPLLQLTTDHQTAIQLTEQAHATEIAGKYKEAYELHAKAATFLAKVVANGKKKSEERRQAKLQLQAANDRQDALRSCAEGKGAPPQPLPTIFSADKELVNPDGVVPLTLVEMRRWATLPHKEPQVASSMPQALTPLLEPSLPDVVYHVYTESFWRGNNRWVYFHVKDEKKSQTLYTIAAAKHTWFQIPLCTMSRAAEYHSLCAQVVVSPVEITRSTGIEHRLLGRPLTITTGTGTTVVVAPDRVEKTWAPRRFTYGNRRFVWKSGEGAFNMVESLYEVRKEWAVPESKTGKMEDETFERALVWGQSKLGPTKSAVIHMVGGLDQIFREFLLASLVTKLLIETYGHR